MRVLLADDDREQLELRALVLQKKGFETIAVSTPASALREAHLRSPRCAVLDLKIPTQAAGLGLIRDLHALDPEISIFVLTGANAKNLDALAEMSFVREIIEKGASTAYLVKKLAEVCRAAEPNLAAFRARLALEKSLTFDVKAIPRAQRSEVVGIASDGALRVKVAAVPEKGKANEELRDVLAAWFGVPKSHVELLQGETSQRKVWRVRR